MPALQHLYQWLAPVTGAAALAWGLAVSPFRSGGRLPVLREDDLSDWLLADIGWRDGRDPAARRMRQRCDRPPRVVL